MFSRIHSRRTAVALHFIIRLCLVLAVAACSSSPDTDATCTPGAIGCACDANQCDDGLTCSQSMCFAEGAITLQVVDPRARGCEVLLVEDGTEVMRVEFANRVRGTYVHEAPKTAVVFIAAGDHAIADGQVTVRFKENGLAAPAIQSVHCVDQDGVRIADAEVKIRG